MVTHRVTHRDQDTIVEQTGGLSRVASLLVVSLHGWDFMGISSKDIN